MAAGGSLEPFWNLYQARFFFFLFASPLLLRAVTMERPPTLEPHDGPLNRLISCSLPPCPKKRRPPPDDQQVHKREPSVREILAELRIGTLKHTPQVRIRGGWVGGWMNEWMGWVTSPARTPRTHTHL